MNLKWSLGALVLGLVVLVHGVSYWASTTRLQEAISEREVATAQTLAATADTLFATFTRRGSAAAQLLARDARIAAALALSRDQQGAALAGILDGALPAAGVSEVAVFNAQEIATYRARVEGGGVGGTGKWGVYEALGGATLQTVDVIETGLVFRTVVPLRAGDRIVGALSTGLYFDQAEIDRLAANAGAALLLLDRSRRVLQSTDLAKLRQIDPSDKAVAAAFHEKIPVFRHDAVNRLTNAFVPVLIVDEAFVLVMQLDSSPAYAVLEHSTQQALKSGLALLVASLLLASVVLRYALAPLRRLGLRSQRIAIDELGEPMEMQAGDELTATLKTMDTLTERLVARNRELEQSRRQAYEANRAKSRFLASMSHEIRTPLNGVLGMADLLRDSALDATQRRQLEAIAASGRALRDLLGDILDLSKIEAGKVELESADFDLSLLVKELLVAYQELAGARGNVLRAELDLRGSTVFCGDATRVRQVIANFVSNAIKFTENGRIDLGVSALDARPGDRRRWIRITVKDTGIGMSAGTLAKLFQPFTQADSSTTRRYGGSGLGLTIAKRLTELMQGTLAVQSAPGAGTEFRVELPLAPPLALADVIPIAASAAGRTAPLSVLLVEDNDINQEVALAMLQSAGHRVDLASDGAEAVRLCAARSYDCVLMDCQMPVMDGYEATRRIRAREAEAGAARVPIVALTANAMSGDRERCLAAGMDGFLSKPFNTATLLAALAQSAPGHALPQQVANA